MNYMNSEKSNAQDFGGAGIGRNVVALEQAEAKGRYTAVCIGPREEDRARYVKLRDKIATHESRKFLAKLLAAPLMWGVQREFEAIPLEDKWTEEFDNLVTTVGKNDALDKYLAGSAYTAAWYLGLVSATSYTTGPAAADTMASHAGWAEDQNYSQATRPAPSFSAASAGSKTTSAAVAFSINASTTIKGCFLNTVNTKGGTTGTLYSAGLFTGGDKVVAGGDTLNVTYTASL